MTKYYRVLKDTFMWEEGAILHDDIESDGYQAISDLWDKVPLKREYITRHIIENPDNADTFERIYPIGDLKKKVFGNKLQAKAAAAALYKGDEKATKS